jgi:predicted O-methyltransferase YrrM
MVETGVAQGLTSSAILEAMERNGRGHLYSVDLPPLHADRAFIGRLIPQAVRHRWTLVVGPSRKMLLPLVRRVASLDAFLHDAEHSYESQREEYLTVWPHLRPGGVLLSDDVANPAFVEFADEARTGSVLVGDADGSSAVGLLRKRSQ